MGSEAGADAARRIATQRHDVAHSGLPIVADDGIDLVLAGADASQVRGGLEAGRLADAPNRVEGAVAGGAPGAIGDRDETRMNGFKFGDGTPEDRFGLARLRGEEFE